jgi:hypothetical protein
MTQRRGGGYIRSGSYPVTMVIPGIQTNAGQLIPTGVLPRPGVWTLEEVMQYTRAGEWPTYPASVTGQVEYITPGTYTFIAANPIVSVVCVGAGGGGSKPFGGGGGGLGYINNYPLELSKSYPVFVGAAALGLSGQDSYFISPAIVKGGGGIQPSTGGSYVGDGGGNGGNSPASSTPAPYGSGGGGAGGYSGNGGDSSDAAYTAGLNGSGGGGGGGGNGMGPTNLNQFAGGGGGVGIYGEGPSGVGGARAPAPSSGLTAFQGGGGSSSPSGGVQTQTGGTFGGGAGGVGASRTGTPLSIGSPGAVRIIYSPTLTREFPSTNTGDL